MKKTLLAVTLAVAALMAHAEANPAKKELINKMLQLQQGLVDNTARAIAEQPALQLMQQAATEIRFRVPPEKREVLGKEIQADLKKYIDDVMPMVKERANKLSADAVGSLLDDRFTEDELRQLIAFFESPVQRKYSQFVPEIQRTLGEKLLADMRGQIEPKAKALQQSIGKRLDAATKPPAAK